MGLLDSVAPSFWGGVLAELALGFGWLCKVREVKVTSTVLEDAVDVAAAAVVGNNWDGDGAWGRATACDWRHSKKNAVR